MNELSTNTDDHALEVVPESERQTWLRLSWGTTGIVTTLVQLFVGALATFVAGFWIGLISGISVAIVGGLMGWAVGNVAYKTGLSSSVLARFHGFGTKGSIIVALTFGFMITGFIALENVLLYEGFIFWSGLEDNPETEWTFYAVLSILWILLTAFGFKEVTAVASLTLIAFLGVLIYLMIGIVQSSGQSWVEVFTFGAQLPPDALAALGADTTFGKYAFCFNVMIGAAGALALIDADLGRYSKSSKDIGIAAGLGNLFMNVIMLVVGAAVMYAGSSYLIDYYVGQGVSLDEAKHKVLNSPHSVAAAFIILGGVFGAILLFLAQGKAQVLNTYSASLSLTNIADVIFGWRPGRLFFVVVANMIACLMIALSILDWFSNFITVLGVLTTSIAAIIIADYYLVSGERKNIRDSKAFNWPGITTTFVSFVSAHLILDDYIEIEFISSVLISFILYPMLSFVFSKKNKEESIKRAVS
ncbi:MULTISPECIES: cytosine permease [Marinobacterium]|uniref:purine-cytosine permease family protein n=1 Tax=Marinobacterium TaxID=48075 RepID=UPI001A90CA6A|nr:cytosine permease [Marinobacterium iners]